MPPERSSSNLSRAEQLRQKRRQSSQSRVEQARQHAARPNSAPVQTVVRRPSPYSVPVSRSIYSKPVRKVHYAQTGNGVEVRLPALPHLQFNAQIASAFLAVVVLALVLLLTNLDGFQVKNVEVTGISRVSAADIQATVVGANRSIFTLDRQKTIDAVQAAFPELKNIHLKVAFPNSVIMTVKERQPIVSWNSQGETEWIDAEGAIMPARGDGGSLLPITSSVAAPLLVTGSASDSTDTTASSTASTTNAAPVIKTIDPQVLQAALKLATQLPEGSSLVYDPISGMGWTDSRGWKVYFGLDLSNIQLKMGEYQAIVDRLTSLGVTPTLISVEHVDAPYYRME